MTARGRTGRRRSNQRGATILEFTLVGVAMIFVIISFFEMARGMWTYQNLAYAVREGTRYAALHGQDCAPPQAPGSGCQVTTAQIVGKIQSAGPGLDPDNTTITFTTNGGAAVSHTMTYWLSDSTVWPPSTDYSPGKNVQLRAVYPFRTILAMFWVGDGHPLNDSQVFNLGASSTEPIQF